MGVLRDKSRRLLVQHQEKETLGYSFLNKNLSINKVSQLNGSLLLDKRIRGGFKSKVRNHCVVTGRGRSVYRKLKLSRIIFREMASKGLLPGIQKSSW